MSTEIDTSMVQKLKLKLKLAINRSKSSNANTGTQKGRVLGGRNGVGREGRIPSYVASRSRNVSRTDDSVSVKETFRSNGRYDTKARNQLRGEVRKSSTFNSKFQSDDSVSVKETFRSNGRYDTKARNQLRGEVRKSSTLNSKFRSVGARSKSEFPRVGRLENGIRKSVSVEKSLRTIWVPSKNDRVIHEDKQSGRMGQRSDVSDIQKKVKNFKRKEADGLAYRGNASLNKDLGKSRRRTNLGGKIAEDGRSGETITSDDQLRKRKRIRIHRLDVSNKRLDDTIMSEETKSKEDDDKDKTLSMNAQFRAIKPTPSILSFVEDNFLGRRRMLELQRAGYNIDLSAPLDNIPNSTSSERERIEESVFRNRLEFFAAAKIASSFPPPDLPEIAFAGRSNVGKSSLLNALTRQWGVVRTSDKPGHTRTINFFKLGTKLNMVDLPGYGFAYAKEEVKDAWEELVKEYVSTRTSLNRVCLLVDTKWGMKPRDHELIGLMERSQTKYQIVLTKTDAVPPIDVARRAMQIEENLKANRSIVQPLMMVSSRTGAGIRCMRTALAKIGRFVKV
ncbi:unnamed protein product [Rhodiola kirilowii]